MLIGNDDINGLVNVLLIYFNLVHLKGITLKQDTVMKLKFILLLFDDTFDEM